MKAQAIELFKRYTKGDVSMIINVNGYRVRVSRKGRKIMANEISKEKRDDLI